MTQSKVFSTNKTLRIGGKLIDLSTPKVMGILNVTPDSFYDGGRFANGADALRQTEKMINQGAAFIDVGGYSTRPGAQEVDEQEETVRVVGAIEAIAKEFPDAVISVDTFRSGVARRAIGSGASLVNDISGGDLDPTMIETIADLKVPYILMHMRGTPQTMTRLTTYNNLIKDVIDYFHKKIKHCEQLGISDLIVDPGFGFAKSIEQNFQLLEGLHYFKILGRPILAGLSRKSLIWKTLGKNPDTALNGTTALNTIALTKGASILRVHDVAEAVECIKLTSLLKDKEY